MPAIELKRRWRFKQTQSRGQVESRAVTERGEDLDSGRGGRRLLCVRCGNPITTSAERIEKSGLHEHSQVNPHGYVWRFGCFAAAPGCVPVSAPSTEFSWFPGFAWQIASCGRCRFHLGWRFVSGDSSFHGLILDRLVERDESEKSS